MMIGGYAEFMILCTNPCQPLSSWLVMLSILLQQYGWHLGIIPEVCLAVMYVCCGLDWLAVKTSGPRSVVVLCLQACSVGPPLAVSRPHAPYA